MADGSGGDRVTPATMEELKKLLSVIAKNTAESAQLDRWRSRDSRGGFGSTHIGPVIVQPGANEAPLLNWPQDGCDPVLEAITIDVDWTFHTDPSSSGNSLDTMEDAFLSVYWGTIGHRAEFDLMSGTSVTVCGHRALLKVSYAQAAPQGAAAVPQPQLAVRASICKGTKQYGGIVGVARRTFNLGTIGPGATSAKVKIPDWAKEIGMSNLSIAAPTSTLLQFPNGAAAAPLRWVGTIGKGSIDTVPRDSYSNWCALTNTSNAEINAKLVFYLGR